MGSIYVKQHLSRMIAIAIVAVGVFSVFGYGGQAFAAPTSKTNNQNTLKLSPIRSDIILGAGKSGTVTITLSNLTSAPMVVQPIQNDFIAGDERGTPALILDANKFAPTHSLKRFMAPLKNITIPAGKDVDVKLTINVPANAQAGGYYGAVRFAPVIDADAKSVNLNASAASLVLLTVPGPTEEKLNLTSFDIKQGDKVDTIFQSANDLMLAFRMENKGNVQLGPFGNISVKQGDKVIYSYEFNTENPRELVLPDSARRWDVPLKNIGSFGNYTVTATLSYGSKNQTIEVSKSFWIIPMAVIFATIGGVIFLILLIVGIWLFLRSYKRRILGGSGRRGGYRR